MTIKIKTETKKLRNLVGATAFSMAVLSGSAYGLGLGKIELDSALNQPFSAEIEVLVDVPGEMAGLVVQLASRDAFKRAGIDRPQSLSNLDFSLHKRDGRSFILVKSARPIVEPFLNFLVEVDWKRGNLVREYTVLLDPPTYVANKPSTTVSPANLAEVDDATAMNPDLPARIERGVSASGYTATALTEEELAAELAAVTEVLGSGVTQEEANDSLVAELREVDDLLVVDGGGESLIGDDVRKAAVSSTAYSDLDLKEADDKEALAQLELGAPADVSVASKEQVSQEPAYTETAIDDIDSVVAALDRELMGQSSTAPDKPAKTVAAPGSTLTPVRKGQTLWSIASANRVSGVTVEQMMVALLNTNPEAFEDGNINALNSGAILRVPTAGEVSEMSSQNALSSVSEQNALWKKYRDQARSKSVEAQQGESAADVSVASADTAGSQVGGTLKLVADTDEAKTGEEEAVEANTAVSAEGKAQVAELRNQLSLAQEEAETERQRAEEMNSRVTDLELALNKMNKLLELRSNELNSLQNASIKGGEEAAAEAARQQAAELERIEQLQLAKEEAARQAAEAEAGHELAAQEVADLNGQIEGGGAEADTTELDIPETNAEVEGEAWYKPYMTADNAKIAGGVAAAGIGLFALLGLRRKRKETALFSEDSYVKPDNSIADATHAYEEAKEAADDDGLGVTNADYDDATAYGHEDIAGELSDGTADVTDLSALDATLSEEGSSAGNVDILQEADVYLSYGLADRAEELLDGAIASDPSDGMLQAKRLEALFVKRDGVSFEAAATTYHSGFGGDKAPHWDKVAAWGAALAPASGLFQGVEAANLDETQDITSLDTTKIVGGAAAAVAAVGGLAASAGEPIEEGVGKIGDAIDLGADISEKTEAGPGLSEAELGDALDSTLSELSDAVVTDAGDDLSAELAGVDPEGMVEDLEATTASLGDDLESMSEGLEDDLEMTDLESTLAGDSDLQDMLDATGGGDDFELSLSDEGAGAGGGLAGDLESDLLNTDVTGSLGGLSEEIDFEGAGLSLADETTDADMTVAGDEVDTMLDLARAYIDMGDADSASSTIAEILATGNAEQVSAAKELQSQIG